MKNKTFWIRIGTFLIGLFLIVQAMEFFGIPTFYDALVWIFGKPTFWSKIIVSIVGFFFVLGCFILFIKIIKRGNRER